MIKKKSYKDFWESKGSYGKRRYANMIARKQKRHDRRSNRLRGGLKRIDGVLHQVCDYQPLGCFHTSWCRYPCEGDC